MDLSIAGALLEQIPLVLYLPFEKARQAQLVLPKEIIRGHIAIPHLNDELCRVRIGNDKLEHLVPGGTDLILLHSSGMGGGISEPHLDVRVDGSHCLFVGQVAGFHNPDIKTTHFDWLARACLQHDEKKAKSNTTHDETNLLRAGKLET